MHEDQVIKQVKTTLVEVQYMFFSHKSQVIYNILNCNVTTINI